MTTTEPVNNPSYGRTRLITGNRCDSVETLTNRRETDCRTALTRGLKEYVETLSAVGADGREIEFINVFQSWASVQVDNETPSAIAYTPSPCQYSEVPMTPQVFDLDSGITMKKTAELECDVVLELWASDPTQRMLLVAMLEDAFDPGTDAETGFVLELPHYHNARAVFIATQVEYLDSSEDIQHGWNKAAITLSATVSKYVSFNRALPRLRTKFFLDTDTSRDDRAVNIETD